MTATQPRGYAATCLSRRGAFLFVPHLLYPIKPATRDGQPDTRPSCFVFKPDTSNLINAPASSCFLHSIYRFIDMQDIDESPWDDSPLGGGGMTHVAEAEWTRLSSSFQNVSFTLSSVLHSPPPPPHKNEEPPLRQVSGRIPRRNNRREGRRAPRRVRYRLCTNRRTSRT